MRISWQGCKDDFLSKIGGFTPLYSNGYKQFKQYIINLVNFWPNLAFKAWPVAIYSKFLSVTISKSSISFLGWYLPFHSVELLYDCHFATENECFISFGLFIYNKNLDRWSKDINIPKSLVKMAIKTHNHSFGLVCKIHKMQVLYILWKFVFN